MADIMSYIHIIEKGDQKMTLQEIRDAGWTALTLRLVVASETESQLIKAELKRREDIGRISFKSAGARRAR